MLCSCANGEGLCMRLGMLDGCHRLLLPPDADKHSAMQHAPVATLRSLSKALLSLMEGGPNAPILSMEKEVGAGLEWAPAWLGGCAVKSGTAYARQKPWLRPPAHTHANALLYLLSTPLLLPLPDIRCGRRASEPRPGCTCGQRNPGQQHAVPCKCVLWCCAWSCAAWRMQKQHGLNGNVHCCRALLSRRDWSNRRRDWSNPELKLLNVCPPFAEDFECWPAPSDSIFLPADAYQAVQTWEGEWAVDSWAYA